MMVRHGLVSGSGAKYSLSKLSSREAVFMVSPTMTYSERSALPSVPATTGPVKMPTRMPLTGFSSARQRWLSWRRAVSMASAHSTALLASWAISASVRRGTGTPNTATTESPAYCRMTPPCWLTCWAITSMYSFSHSMSCSGDFFSAVDV
jgi:hypothetical protein